MSLLTINHIVGLAQDQFARIVDRLDVIIQQQGKSIEQGEQMAAAQDDLKKAVTRIAEAQIALAAAIATHQDASVPGSVVEEQVALLNGAADKLESLAIALGPVPPAVV